MAEGCELDRVHAFWLGKLFVSPPLRHVARGDGVAETVSRPAMRLLVALKNAPGTVTGEALIARCEFERPAMLDRALRRLDRLARGVGEGSFTIRHDESGIRLVELSRGPSGAAPSRALTAPVRVAAVVGGVIGLLFWSH